MPGFGDILQKAVYLGVGLASYAGEKAGSKLTELRTEAQKLADELVKRGEMSTEEARRFVDDMVQQAQQQSPVESPGNDKPAEPRRIEIVSEAEDVSPKDAKETGGVDKLREQVQNLQDELRKLKQD
ncbi:phasin family protein [Tychonema sp. LEGE 07203]|uniref:phasin family protein n=1 Tax=Tychonema sp. LEGE 07203 TaxID=1828671 RepID=UPI00188261F6|nr:phasin family protein [Tychonema sp. LEGE 07203]MBE9095914.1 phasin family protein [Tychonema sp. LEGE 07203]